MEEIKRSKMGTERDMKSEFSAMNERLNAVCGSKLAILQHDLTDLQSDVDRVNNIITTVETCSHDTVNFLRRSVEIRDAIEMAISKPFRTEINVYPEELPTELSEIR